jgi:GDP-L-fucose synthase
MKLFEGKDAAFHLAAHVGGIGYNLRHPAELAYDNLMMGLNVLEACRRHDLEWVLIVGSACAYPGDAPVPTEEHTLWKGYPEPSNGPYGVAKRTIIDAALAFARQYGMKISNVIPANLYGPYDDFDPERAHVLPALMSRFHAAMMKGERSVTCWGDGIPTRDFLYVEDCAELISRAPGVIQDARPVNLATGREVSIRDLAGMIRDVVGYSGRILWDASKPKGQQRRALSTGRMEELFGPFQFTPLEVGLRKTYAYYLVSKWAQRALVE